jgi:Protein of unknown function (DUF3040)
MSLPVSEERALTGIEQALLCRDPRLKSLFAIFTRLTRHEAMPAIEQLRRRRWQPPAGAVILLAIALMVGAIVMGSLGSTSGCGPAQPTANTAAHPSAGAPSASDRGCSPRSISGVKTP